MRVNARFEGVAEEQVTYLTAKSGKKISEVLRESVDFYYQHVHQGAGQVPQLSKLIGKGRSGQADIASNLKKYLAESLATKHGARSL